MGTTWETERLAGGGGLLPLDDRADAGRLLAGRLRNFVGHDALVLAIPRGGVPVAEPIARALNAELDVVVARKLGAPGYPELALGAITADGTAWLDDDLLERLHVRDDHLAWVERIERAEAQRRERVFRGGRPRPRIAGRTVIVVDDGLATGATMYAAVDAIRRQDPYAVIVAVPVGTREAIEELHDVADEVLCLALPEPFRGVAAYYRRFPQLEDAEVVRILDTFHAARAGTTASRRQLHRTHPDTPARSP